MKLKLFQVDAFTGQVFKGNPAAVCPLERWLPDAILQAIAEENNLAETAYFVPLEDAPAFHLRWFTPVREVDLCGHATLATAYVLYEQLGFEEPEVRFHTRSGVLAVLRQADTLRMSFPAAMPQPCETPAALVRGLGKPPLATLSAFDYVAVYETEEEIRGLDPDFTELGTLGLRGVVATAPGRSADFVSRFFSPKDGIAEDPVTGSSHCELGPYWAQQLNRPRLHAEQLSRRGGTLLCEVAADNVVLVGKAAHYMTAEITIPD